MAGGLAVHARRQLFSPRLARTRPLSDCRGLRPRGHDGCVRRVRSSAPSPSSRSRSSAPTTCTATSFPRADAAGWRCSAATSRHFAPSRAADGGAVVLLDAGDTFQGGIESNLSEGARGRRRVQRARLHRRGHRQPRVRLRSPLDAFRPSERSGSAGRAQGDRRAQRAIRSWPPISLDDSTGRPVDWPNVTPSTLVERGRLRRRHHRRDDRRRDCGRRWRSTSTDCACRRWRRP